MKRAVLVKTLMIWCLLSISSLVTDSVYAGVTGTLAGRVMDSETGQPLVGVNIIVRETQYGAATNSKGQYVIQNLKPGYYVITAQMMGYTSLTKTDVVIRIDARTNINFALAPTTLSLDKEIIVTAPRELIQMDITSSQHEVRGELIKALPVATPEEVVNLQPGVVEGHIRGGRKTEVLYMVDDIPIQEAITGDQGLAIPNVSISDMTILTGGFNAEYGNAMSGIINIVTHEGTNKHRLYLEGYSDYPGQVPGSQDRTSFDRLRNFELSMGGPIFSSVYYYLSAQYIASDTRWRRYFRQAFPGPIDKKFLANSKITINFRPSQKLVLQSLLSFDDWRAYEHRWIRNLAGLPPRSKDSFRFNASWTHTISSKTFYSTRVSYYNVLKSILGRQQDQYNIDLKLDDDGLFILSGDKAWWQDSQEKIINAKFDLTSQVHHSHQIKTGLDFAYYDLFMDNVQIEPFPPNYHPELPPEFRFNVYNTSYQYFPKKGSFYLQDKVDLDQLSLNAGLRFDYIDPAGERPVIEEFRKTSSSEIQVFTHKEPISLKSQWSPRFGLSFPITHNDKFHFNYGHFFQAPLFEYLYTNLEFNFFGYNPLIGNPDLAPEKTVALEIGYEREITKDLLFSITAFNKDISNLVDVQYFQIPLKDTGLYSSGTYTRYVNLAYGTAKGLELFLRKKYGEMLKGQVSYTIMSAKGSSFAMGDKNNILQYGGLVREGENYLSWDQLHTIIVYLDYHKNENWGLNTVWRINSPKPYTLDEGVDTVEGKVISPNNKRLDWTNYLDIKFNKSWKLGPGRFALELEIRNLLDSKNLLWRDKDGRIGGILNDPGAFDVGRRLHLGLIWSN